MPQESAYWARLECNLIWASSWGTPERQVYLRELNRDSPVLYLPPPPLPPGPGRHRPKTIDCQRMANVRSLPRTAPQGEGVRTAKSSGSTVGHSSVLGTGCTRNPVIWQTTEPGNTRELVFGAELRWKDTVNQHMRQNIGRIRQAPPSKDSLQKS